MRADPDSGALILGAHHGAAFRSTDGGASWTPATTTHTASMESLLVAGRRTVGFGAGGFLVSSTDAGRTWRVANPPLDVVMREVVALPDSRGAGGQRRAGRHSAFQRRRRELARDCGRVSEHEHARRTCVRW